MIRAHDSGSTARPGLTTRRLRLDAGNGWLGGVCAGLANWLGTDAAFVRVAVVVTGLFLPKLVIAAYLVAWLVLDRAARR